jgi:hypothetical protein
VKLSAEKGCDVVLADKPQVYQDLAELAAPLLIMAAAVLR